MKQISEYIKKAENEVKKNIRNAKNNYERKIAKEGKSQPKQFYAYHKKERSNKVRVGPLRNEAKKLVTDPETQAGLLNDNYDRIFIVSDELWEEELDCLIADEEKLGDIHYSEDRIIKIIESLRREAAGGPDGIPPRILENL